MQPDGVPERPTGPAEILVGTMEGWYRADIRDVPEGLPDRLVPERRRLDTVDVAEHHRPAAFMPACAGGRRSAQGRARSSWEASCSRVASAPYLAAN